MKLKDKIIKNRVGILVIIGVLLVVTIIIGISYAYFFNIEIKNNNTISGNINTNSYVFATKGTGSLSITLDQDKLDIANASNDYSSYVSSDGSYVSIVLDAKGLKKVYCSYDLVYVPSTTYKPNEGAVNAGLKELTLSGTSNNGNSFSEIDISGSSTITLISNVEISTDASVIEEWNFTAKYYNLDVIQDNVIGQTFTGNIKVANTNCSFNEQKTALGGNYVLLKSTGNSSVVDAKIEIEDKGNPDFSIIAVLDEGMLAAKDDLGTSYYFRGAVANNWVKYGKYAQDMYNCNNGTISTTDTGNSCTKIASGGDDIYWRIIRINGDGSIRMIYSGVTPPTESTKVVMTNGTSIGNSPFNLAYNSAEHVGYMYTIGEQHGTGTNSTIKTFLDDWYANYTNLNDLGTKITDQINCYDRTASTNSGGTSEEISPWLSTGADYYYGSLNRIWLNDVDNGIYAAPVLTCSNSNDKFTVSTAYGNGKLSYPVGLISIDEASMAGLAHNSNFEDGNKEYYLYTGQIYWPGSPFLFDSGGNATNFIIQDSYISNNRVEQSYGVRPVVSLSSNVKLKGSGTYDDIYNIVE